MEYTKNRVHLFNGNNHALWSGRMQVHLLAQGYEVWEIVDKGFTLTQDEQGKKNMVYDTKAKDLIINGLIESVYLKVLSCKTAKEVWVKLENIYASDSKVKEAKLQIFRAKFEQLEMRVDEDIVAYFQCVDETTNTLEAFAASKKNSKDKQTLKAKTCNCKDEEKEDEEEFSDKEFAYFTRKMRTSTIKFKCKLPLICFDCGEVGHFATKCPHKNENVTKGKKSPRKFNKQGKKKWFKKSFFSKEDSSSSKEDSHNEEEFNERVLFMAKNNKQEAPDKEGD
eukprot:PITA_22233